MAEVSTQEKLAQRYKEYQDCRQNLKDFTSLEADSVNTLEDITPIINDVRANLKKVIVKEGEKFEGTNSFHMLNENLSGNRTFKCTLSNEGSLYFAVAVRADEGERTILSVTLPPESQKLDRLSIDNLNSFLMQVYDAEGEREGIFFPLRGPDNEQAQRQYEPVSKRQII